MKKYNAYGIWHVTTEGDVEGRTVKDLGVYEGYIDDIAFKLGSKSYYPLRFEPAKKLSKQELVPVNQVNVSLGIDSGTWEMSSEQQAGYFNEMLYNRPVVAKPCNYYAAVTLVKQDIVKQLEEADDNITALEKQLAAAKLRKAVLLKTR